MAVLYVDSGIRQCFPIFVGIQVDYPEQCLLIGVKYNQYCLICTVPPDRREKLNLRYAYRTHAGIKVQILKQQTTRVEQSSPEQVYEFDNFLWKHQLVNCYKIFMCDILYQLFKGLVMYVKSWIALLLENKMRPSNKRASQSSAPIPKTKIKKARKRREEKQVYVDITSLIDKRYAQMTIYLGLRCFRQFLKLKQQIGKDQKNMLKVMVPVYTPLLVKYGLFDAIQCIRVVVDFYTLA